MIAQCTIGSPPASSNANCPIRNIYSMGTCIVVLRAGDDFKERQSHYCHIISNKVSLLDLKSGVSRLVRIADAAINGKAKIVNLESLTVNLR